MYSLEKYKRRGRAPEGWRVIEWATTAPRGWLWYSNGKSMFGGEYEQALYRDDNYRLERWEVKEIFKHLQRGDKLIGRRSDGVDVASMYKYTHAGTEYIEYNWYGTSAIHNKIEQLDWLLRTMMKDVEGFVIG